MKLPDFDYKSPSRLDEAIALLSEGDGSARLIAGGQSLLPIMAFRLSQPSTLIDLAGIPGLDRIDVTATGVRFGPLVTWRQILDDHRLAAACPLLAAAIPSVAHYQIRNRGTIGGSLAHADPAAEAPAVALACEAIIEAAGPRGSRNIPASELFVGPLMTSLESDEIIVRIEFPLWPAERRFGFTEFSRRRGDFALAGVALFYDLDSSGRAENAHFGALGAADTPIRLSAAEAAVNGQAVNEQTIARAAMAARQEVQPAGDMHGSAAYRKSLVGTMLERALMRASIEP